MAAVAGAFRVEMMRRTAKERSIVCRYDPTEAGIYTIHVKWSGVHVPGSPFNVHIFNTAADLELFEAEFRTLNGELTVSSGQEEQ